MLACGVKPAPSGIDRVELAYARHWAERPAECSTFVAQGPMGRWATLPRSGVADLVAGLTEAWGGRAEDASEARLKARRIASGLRLRATLGLGARALGKVFAQPGPKVFLLVSHRALERQGPIRALRARGCAFVPLIHDLIPATHPEYARPGQSGRHLRRIGTTAALADGVIVNSAHTALALSPHLRARALPPPVLVAPLGIDPLPSAARTAAGPVLPLEPYFITLGTIEPRKNHLLLLHLWRDLVRQQGVDAPRLLLVGRRGWENENVVDILERSPSLRGAVHELGSVPDNRVWDLLRGARALLFPSFAEGYGLPLAEALAIGVPAICSDLPALREVGGVVPDYLDPLDGAGWRDLVQDYAQPDSPARAAQLSRLGGWRAPRWEDHFRRVDALLRRITVRTALGQLPAQATPGAALSGAAIGAALTRGIAPGNVSARALVPTQPSS
ncbi:glycosyltransferase family 4 protein [Roseomonas sp. BN140053]|uniref:glycosyltransferase family 4 protein n=1 Tax=Roseomonas sp. BN140053 TaxID=3391898 RepID=UPI0039EB515E